MYTLAMDLHSHTCTHTHTHTHTYSLPFYIAYLVQVAGETLPNSTERAVTISGKQCAQHECVVLCGGCIGVSGRPPCRAHVNCSR